MTAHLLLLGWAATLACGRPCSLDAGRHRPVLLLRGGASAYGTPVRRYQYESGRPFEPPAVQPQQSRSLIPQEPAMSDAERVYVAQQFQRQAVRKDFLKRVYSTVAGQLMLTCAVVALLRGSPGVVFELLRRVGALLFFLPLIPLFLLQFASRSRQSGSPLAYLLLAAFTVLEGVAIGSVTLPLPLDLILRAAGTTAIATGGLSLYALTTKRDFTIYGGMLVSVMLGLASLGLMQLFFGGSWITSVRLGLGTIVFCGYLLVNTQMMMGGDKKRQVRPEEHILAAVNIYTDIINIFMHVLMAMARDRE